MRLMLDTRLLLRAAIGDETVPQGILDPIDDPANQIFYSPASVWKIAMKARLGRPGFSLDPVAFAQGLAAHGYTEIPITNEHIVTALNLPPLHKDPFDRIMIAQSMVEQIVLFTFDRLIGQYEGCIYHL